MKKKQLVVIRKKERLELIVHDFYSEFRRQMSWAVRILDNNNEILKIE